MAPPSEAFAIPTTGLVWLASGEEGSYDEIDAKLWEAI
jgi:hypothetical protein